MIIDNRVTELLNATSKAAKQALGVDNAGLMQLKKIYGETKAHDVLLQCMYMVKIENIFNIKGDIPWFKDKTLTYLVTEAELSFGSGEAETFYAGALPAGYMTQKTDDEMDMTFIETLNGDEKLISRYEINAKNNSLLIDFNLNALTSLKNGKPIIVPDATHYE